MLLKNRRLKFSNLEYPPVGLLRPNADHAGQQTGAAGAAGPNRGPGFAFLRWTANRSYDHKNMVRTPDFKDRLGAASAAKKAQRATPR